MCCNLLNEERLASPQEEGQQGQEEGLATCIADMKKKAIFSPKKKGSRDKKKASSPRPQQGDAEQPGNDDGTPKPSTPEASTSSDSQDGSKQIVGPATAAKRESFWSMQAEPDADSLVAQSAGGGESIESEDEEPQLSTSELMLKLWESARDGDWARCEKLLKQVSKQVWPHDAGWTEAADGTWLVSGGCRSRLEELGCRRRYRAVRGIAEGPREGGAAAVEGDDDGSM